MSSDFSAPFATPVSFHFCLLSTLHESSKDPAINEVNENVIPQTESAIAHDLHHLLVGMSEIWPIKPQQFTFTMWLKVKKRSFKPVWFDQWPWLNYPLKETSDCINCSQLVTHIIRDTLGF